MKNQDCIVSNLIPIDFINEYKKKQLPLGMCFFKICKNFPKSEIGKMKSAQMHYEKDFINKFINNEILAKSLLKKRSKTVSRIGPYTKFLIKSLIKTCAEDCSIPEFDDKSFTFSKNSKKYKVTTNDNKKLDNKIFIDPNVIFDINNLVSFNCLKKISDHLPIKLNEFKLELANKYVNEIRQKYLDLYEKNQLECAGDTQKLKDIWKQENLEKEVVLKKVS